MKGKNNPLLPVALLALLIIGATYLLVLKPARAGIGDAQIKRDDLSSQLAAAKAEIRSRTPDPNDTEQVALAAKIPPTPATPEFFAQISALGASTGVSITHVDVAPMKASSVETGSEIPVSLAALGSRSAIDQFTTGLANLGRLTILSQINLHPTAAADALAADPNAAPSADRVALEVNLSMFTGQQPSTPT